jgi:hypothetical protein
MRRMATPHEELIFAIEAWSLDGSQWTEVLARACNVAMAHAAFAAARECRPNSRIKIRQGAWLIRDSVEEKERSPQVSH